jgi:hypothetical protein
MALFFSISLRVPILVFSVRPQMGELDQAPFIDRHKVRTREQEC